jgi:phage terminase large subunit
MTLESYHPHEGQLAFHDAIEKFYRFVAMICGIRAGKTYCGAREAGRQAWNSMADKMAVYGIIAPTFNMLDRTTWREFKDAMRPLILSDNDSKKIITLRNGRQVFGFSAEDPDRIRNVTLCGFWVDEAREAKNFKELWKVLLGRVLSTGGKGIVTTSPNSYDDLYSIFIEDRKPEYGTVRFSTYENSFIGKQAIDELASLYDQKFMQQELLGEIVTFEGAVYYTFNRKDNAGDLAFKLAQYDPSKPIGLACDFNVDPLSWVYVIDEIFLRNSNTVEACQEFKNRYPNHKAGLVLYGDATGSARHTDSNITNWKIIETELANYGVTKRVPLKNPAERDRINAVNSMICNSKGKRRVFVNPKCKHIISDLEQVSFKEGSTQIDKTRDLMLTHPSDALGYLIEKEYSLYRGTYKGLAI